MRARRNRWPLHEAARRKGRVGGGAHKSEDDTSLLAASRDVWFERGDHDGKRGWQAVRRAGGDVMVQLLYPDGGERVGSDDEDGPDSYIALMLAHPRVRELMRMTSE